MQHICSRWRGPIVVSVFSGGATEEHKTKLREKVTTKCPSADVVVMGKVAGLTEEDW